MKVETKADKAMKITTICAIISFALTCILGIVGLVVTLLTGVVSTILLTASVLFLITFLFTIGMLISWVISDY